MAGGILDTLGIYDAESDEVTQLENMDSSNTHQLTGPLAKERLHQIGEEPHFSGESRAPKLLGTFATDPVSGASVHFCRKNIGSTFLVAKRHSSERSFLKLIEATEKRFPDLSLGPVYGEKIADGMACGTGQLWVDKYAPQKFTDLLSNDKVNVEVLKWVSQWKGVEEKMKMAPKGTDPRPEKKILLVSGPPGLGKTTLCQVIADVAGYNLVEINASDERTGDSVTQKITTAIGSNTLFSRPNLVMIDEIDGAANTGSDTSLIGYLVRLCAQPSKKGGFSTDGDPVEEDETTRSDPKKKKSPHCRPIICICNNLYAPALKPLRHVAQIIQLRKPSPLVLSKRLKTICDLEGFKVDSKSLVDLCEMMECDLRSCLHALQFLSRTKKQLIGGADLLKTLSSGLKDIGRTDFTVIEQIFTYRPKSSNTTAAHQSRSVELETMIQQISKDQDQLVDACHQIFLHSRFFDDSHLTKVNLAYDWLGAADLWRSSTKAQFQLIPFVQCAPIKFSSLFASPNPLEPVSFKKIDFEMSMRTKRNESILQDYLQGIAPLSRATSGGLAELLTERAPLLQLIIKPNLRAPNPQLLKPAEKLQLARLVRTMASEGVTYRETRCEDGTYFMSMDPAIDRLTKISSSSLEPPHLTHHDSAIRKLIAHEVVQEKIRSLQERQGTARKPSVDKMVPAKRKDVPVVAKAIKRDFFGRIIAVVEEPDTDQSASSQQPSAIKICYRFNEGFSNAVRRNVRIKDLFPSQFK